MNECFSQSKIQFDSFHGTAAIKQIIFPWKSLSSCHLRVLCAAIKAWWSCLHFSKKFSQFAFTIERTSINFSCMWWSHIHFIHNVNIEPIITPKIVPFNIPDRCLSSPTRLWGLSQSTWQKFCKLKKKIQSKLAFWSWIFTSFTIVVYFSFPNSALLPI